MSQSGLALVAVLALAAPGRGENWPCWRGPGGNAVSAEKPLPLRWSATENVKWKTAIPGEGASSPIVWEDRLFVTSALKKGELRVVHCLDRKTGTLLWSKEIVDKSPELTSAVTGHAAATAATDGKHVVAVFGNAGAVCYDFAGKLLWQKNLGEFDSELGLASSPVLYRDRVILVCDHDGDKFKSFDSYLICLEMATGKTLWKTDRPDLFRSWSTPILVPRAADRGLELVVNGQDQLRAYDPDTGKQLWHVEGMTGWVTPSPVFGQGLIFAQSGRNGPVMAVKPGGAGDVTKTHVAWENKTGGPYVCSAVLFGDYLHVHNEQGIVTCYEAKTGVEKYKERLEGKFWASAVAGDGKVYIANEAGTTFVLEAGPKFKVLARNELKEETQASPAVSGGELFLRTERHIYCISRR